MLKARGVDGPTPTVLVAAEVRISSRRRSPRHASPVPLVNFTMIQPIGHAFELFGTIRNLFNEQYADPVSGQNLQDTIPQNGLTFRVGVRLKFGLK
jgi:outer membrane receptor protein involved in Fe transport